MDKKYTVGLTGGIGSGKSTVANAFKDLGIKVIDADAGARAVVAPGSEALNLIEKHFNSNHFTHDSILINGQLNRAALREIIFNHAEQKVWLEQLLHPLIGDWITEKIQQSNQSPYIILESPLLFETDQHKRVDTSLLVDITSDLQRQRASQRDGVTTQEIQSIIDSQMSREEKIEKAEYIFDNSLDIHSLTTNVLDFHHIFIKLAQ